jgi:hypothetical protein
VAEGLTKLTTGMTAADLARLGAEYGLGECEQQQFDRNYPLYRGIGLLVLTVSVFFIPMCVIALVAPGSQGQLNFEFGLIIAPITGCLVAAGALLTWCPRPLRVDRTFWFSGGLIQITLEEPEPQVIRWDDVVSLSVQVERPDEGLPAVLSSTVSDQSGTSVTVRAMASALAAKASGLLVPIVVPAFLREYHAGRRVRFGPVWIDRSGVGGAAAGIGHDPEFVAWEDVREIRINARTGLSIRAVGRRRDLFIDLGVLP